MEKILYVKYSNNRGTRFNIQTRIVENEKKEKVIIKEAMTQESQEHIEKLSLAEELLRQQYRNTLFIPAKCRRKGSLAELEYIEGQSLGSILDIYYNEGKTREFNQTLQCYIDNLYATANQDFVVTEEFKEVFGDIYFSKAMKSAEVTNIDIIPENILVSDDKWYVIDYEWTFVFPIPVQYVLYRTLFYYYVRKYGEKIYEMKEIFEAYGISAQDIKTFQKMEKHFQSYVADEIVPIADMYRVFGKNTYNIDELVAEHEKFVHEYDFQVYYEYGQGYSEDRSAVYNIQPDKTGVIHFTHDVDEKLNALRIDPAKSCIIRILDCIGTLKDNTSCKLAYTGNGLTVGESLLLFSTCDPQIILDLKTAGVIHVELKMEMISFSTIDNQMLLLLDKCVKDRDEYKAQNIMLKTQISEIESQVVQIEAVKKQLEEQVHKIMHSGSWRLTKPLRLIRRKLKKISDNKFSRQFGRGVRSLRQNGVRLTWIKVKGWVRKKFYKLEPKIYRNESDIIISDTAECMNCKKKIAVHLHLFYMDLLEEFCGYLDNIPYAFDLFISCQPEADKEEIKRQVLKIRSVNKVIVKSFENRGRDIAPLFVGFSEDIRKYDYLLHMHTKKSLYTGSERAGWRQYSLESLIGSESLIRKIFALFEKNEDYGLVYPDNHEDVPMLAYSWLKNEQKGRQLMQELGIPFEAGIFMYPAGSFYWARVKAIMPLFDRRFTIEEFPKEAGQTDGTLAHAIERVIEFVVKSRNYNRLIVDYAENVFRVNTSTKAFRPYFGCDISSFEEQLNRYQVISFDIFDTLITRCVLKPDDVFRLMDIKIRKKYKTAYNFLELRKRAEAKAWEKKQAFTDIDDIYNEFAAVASISNETAMQIKQMEIDTEYDVVLPRKDMLKVFNYLKAKNKKIILVSDMYLTKDIIAALLKKCGYEGYEDIIVSCEVGLRKDNDTIWNMILPKYKDEQFIHIGDNPRSDWQTLIDRKKAALWVINPIDAFKMSPCYASFCNYMNDSVENSIIMGMTLNGGIFNSPFSQTAYTGIPEIQDAWTMGFGVFGMLMCNYIRHISIRYTEHKKLLFLAREGYILKKMYSDFMQGLGKPELENHYFLASRRAVSVAAIKDSQDFKNIIGQYYRGSLSNMLYSRLGISLFKDEKDRDIMLDFDKTKNIEEIINMLENHKKEYEHQLLEEKRNYMQYIKTIVPDGDYSQLEVLDVGYSGTIQYFLSKLLECKVGGYYLATFNTKPDKIGCECRAVYDINNPTIAEIQRTQLFLESVLQAPFGQLICFEKDKNNNIKPTFKNDNEVPSTIKELQTGMLDYCNVLSRIIRDIYDEFEPDDKMICNMYSELLHGKYMSDEVASIFSVQDDYCSNKTLKYNRHIDAWE